MKKTNLGVNTQQSLLKGSGHSLRFSENIGQLVANNLSMISNHPKMSKQASSVNWCNIFVLVLIYACIINCYWLTLYNVTNLEGDKLVNGLILGLSEMTSGIVAGFLGTFTSPAFAFQTSCITCVLFSFLNQFVFAAGSFLGYATLFIAILGVGGVNACSLVLIGVVIPKHQVGGAMVLIVTLAVTSSLGAPLLVLYAAPIPFLVLTGLIVVAFTSSCFLPKKLPDEAPEADEETQVYVEV